MEEVREVDRSQMMPTFEQHEALSQPQLGPGVNGRGVSGDHESFQIIRRSRNGRGRQGGEKNETFKMVIFKGLRMLSKDTRHKRLRES